MMTKLHTTTGVWWSGALLACFGTPAAALTTTPTNDAFDLAAALAPSLTGLTSVTGVSVDLGAVGALPGPIGTFTDDTNLFAHGVVSGVVLSTGNIAEIFTGALGTSGVDYNRAPGLDSASLLAQVPGAGSGFFDPVRFTLEIDPGFTANFINFDVAFGTNEVGLTTDRVGIFVNGLFYGFPQADQPLDQFHPWVGPVGSQFGFGENLYPGGDVLAYPFVRVSLPVLTPAQLMTVDFLLADVTDGRVDSALFLGRLNGSPMAEGMELQPIPVPAAAWLLGSVLAGMAGAVRRRRA